MKNRWVILNNDNKEVIQIKTYFTCQTLTSMRSHKYNANRLEVAKIVPKGVQSRGPRVPEIVAVGPAATVDSHVHLDNPKQTFT